MDERTRNANLALREQIDRDSMFEDIVGSSDALRKVLRQVTKVAPADSTVLLLGETGTGKELIARAIHKRSNRAERAFMAVNCAAIPPSLIASELFGHEKGAFTGATQRRLGRFESANGGTIFLDEIGDLPAEIQIALLRVLQAREIERVVILSDGDTFCVDETWLSAQAPRFTRSTVALSGALVRHEKEIIETALAQSRGRVSGPAGAAVKLGIPSQTLDSKIKRLKI